MDYKGMSLTTKVDQYDGYVSKPIWVPEEENGTTYDNVFEDSQGTVPVDDIEIIKEELFLHKGGQHDLS